MKKLFPLLYPLFVSFSLSLAAQGATFVSSIRPTEGTFGPSEARRRILAYGPVVIRDQTPKASELLRTSHIVMSLLSTLERGASSPGYPDPAEWPGYMVSTLTYNLADGDCRKFQDHQRLKNNVYDVERLYGAQESPVARVTADAIVRSLPRICKMRMERLAKAEDVWNQLKKATAVTLEFKRFAPAAPAWTYELVFTNSAFAKITNSGRDYLRVRGSVSVSDCDGKALKSQSAAAGGDIAGIVAGFAGARLLDEFFRCRFTPVSDTAVVSDQAADTLWNIFIHRDALRGRTSSGWGYQFEYDYDGTMIFRASNEASFGGAPLFRFRLTSSSGEDARRLAFEGAQEFVSLLSEHARNILMAASQEGTSREEVEEIIADSIAAKKPEILQALEKINSHFPQLNVMDQMRISLSISDIYARVREIEAQKLQLLSKLRLNLGDTLVREGP